MQIPNSEARITGEENLRGQKKSWFLVLQRGRAATKIADSRFRIPNSEARFRAQKASRAAAKFADSSTENMDKEFTEKSLLRKQLCFSLCSLSGLGALCVKNLRAARRRSILVLRSVAGDQEKILVLVFFCAPLLLRQASGILAAWRRFTASRNVPSTARRDRFIAAQFILTSNF